MNKIIISFILTFITLSANAWDLGSAGRYQFQPLATNVYVMHGPLAEPNKQNQGFMNNPGIIIGDKGITLIDPGSTHTVGQQVLAEIKKISKKPIVAVFNTHIHGDHWLANQAVKQAYPNVNIYGHHNMIKQAHGNQGLEWLELMLKLTEGLSQGTKIEAPNKAIKHGDTITIAGEHFRIHSFLPAHTDTDIMVEHIDSRTLFLGDNCFKDRMGRFDTSSSVLGTIKVLQYAQNLKLDHYVPGHGQSGTASQTIKPFLDYLLALKDIVTRGLEDDLEDYEIKEIALKQLKSYQTWSGFDTNLGKNINKIYLELEAEML